MRVRAILFVPLLFALVAASAPGPGPTPAPPPSTTHIYGTAPNDNETFALLLLEAVHLVEEIYVRPVSQVDLLESALTAVYESARRVTPRDLRQRIERAVKKSTPANSSEAPPPGLIPVLAPRRAQFADEKPLFDAIRSVRAELGPAKTLGFDPLVVGLQAMLHSLDPYSGVLASKEDRRAAGYAPMREGYGLEVPEEDGDRVCIRDVLLGSPAQKAGIKAGDEIVGLCDSDGRERKVKEALNLLNGRISLRKPQLGSSALPEPISITYRRPGEKVDRRATLEWQRFRPESVFGTKRRDDNSWNYWIDGASKIAHIRIGNVVESTPDDLSEILSALRRDGMRGLILDLRGCPGGALDGSRRTAELFLGDGTIATVEYRNLPQDVFRSTTEEKDNAYPMVVLINEDSTGGAEMIAAALQDHHRALLIGQRTHGKGNVQKLRNLGPIGLKVTSGVLLRPNGKPLHRFPDSKDSDPWGVQPDPGHEFRLSSEARIALRTWWEQQTLRPGSSARRLPLDDPLADVQRNAAVETLTEILQRNDRAQSK